ncbi:MAG TPA: helix-turn-helix domain-containing protein [Pirellulales bacterium]|nr:helix-turn-helix domain-containing protein [Pirellulales bacterium]
MPSGRTSYPELLRLLAEVGEGVYLLDEQRRIVFANQSLADWLNVAPADLVGRTCRYQSGDGELLAASADALCPPPEVFQGQKATGVVCKPAADGHLERRCADFIPLAGEAGQSMGVLAIVHAEAPSADEETSGVISAFDGQISTGGAESRHLHELIQRFRQQMARWSGVERLAGESPAMVRVREQIKLAAGGTAAVLIVGPPGIGKQHVASAIHAATQRQWADLPNIGVRPASPANHQGTLMPVSCAALPPEVLLSTVAAMSDRHSRAAGEPLSTLLLVDVHRLAAEVQPEMVRWMDARPPNLRVISTSPEPLETLSQREAFRADLAQRLSTLVIHLPPLAQRRDDIPLLAQMFLEELNGQGGKQLRGFKPEAMDRLALYDWPGQVDELAATVRQAFAQAESFEITAADLPKQLRLAAEAARFPRQPPEPIDLEKFLARVEAELIDRALRQAKGNKSQAARLLGMTRPRLYRRMVQLGLEVGEGE